MLLLKNIFRISTVYDVLVIGGGHSGCQAAHASAKMGVKTILITQKSETIGENSCNPSMGGVGKGHLIRQIEALGGLIGKISDKAASHYRMLNTSKGYSAQGLRALIDRDLYRENMYKELKNTQGLTIYEGSVQDFGMSDDLKTIKHIKLKDNSEIKAKSVILTTGTFLRGMIHIGNVKYPAGRHRRDSDQVEPSSIGLSQTIKKLGFRLGRCKTGTPPRLNIETIDFSELKPQSSEKYHWFSFNNEFNGKQYENQMLPSFITKTNQKTHQIVLRNLHSLPEFQQGPSGYGNGPRYCPSLESKLKKFPNIKNHYIFLEKEGFNSKVIYPTGLSTGLPLQAQMQVIKSIKGLEKAQIFRPAYAIQYDFVDPRQLNGGLQTDRVQNLFLAGQINGTTGYQEAAAQGIIAGINAAQYTKGRELYIPDRTKCMIGVLISDITGLGVTQPYRMLTTRSEHRLLQRFDNADQRLTPDGIRLGLVSEEQQKMFQLKQKLIKEGIDNLERCRMSMKQWKKCLNNKISEETPVVKSAADIVAQHNQITVQNFADKLQIDPRVYKNLNIALKYRTVIESQRIRANKVKGQLIDIQIDMNNVFKYKNQIPAEDYQKLLKEKPINLYIASRIKGIRETTLHTLAFLSKSALLESEK